MSKICNSVTCLLIVTVSLLGSGMAHAGNIILRLSPANPSVGDMVYLQYVCTNVNGRVSQPASVPGFDVKYFALTSMGQKSYYDGHNSVNTKEEIYSCTLRAVKEGKYTFGPVTVGGTRSNSISYTISPARSGHSSKSTQQPANPYMATHQPRLAEAGGNDLFLRAELSDKNPYEQQGVVYSVRLYTSYEGVQPLGSPSGPSFENCTSESVDVADHSFKIVNLNGKQYRSVELMRYILYPSHSGKATIKGNNISFSVKQLLQYDDGSSNRIPVYIREQVDEEVPTVTLNVRPLPASPDGDHVNGVGTFSVKSSVAGGSVVANQILNVKYTVTGAGNLNFVTLPDLASQLPPEIKFVKSESKINAKTGPNGMSGSVEFTVSLIPSKEGKYEIPALTFLFFNPGNGEYVTAKAAGATISVGKGMAVSSDGKNIQFRREMETVGKLRKFPLFIIDCFPFYLVYIVPGILLLGAVLIYRRHVRISADIVGLRRRKAGKMARTRLRKSAYYMRKGKKSQFYSETLKALWDYMAQKLNIPVSELSRDSVSGQLESAGVPQELIAKVIDVIDRCELARYASDKSVEMKSLYSDATDVINSLESAVSKKTES